MFDEKIDKEFNDPLENYDKIIEEVASKYERDQPRFEISLITYVYSIMEDSKESENKELFDSIGSSRELRQNKQAELRIKDIYDQEDEKLQESRHSDEKLQESRHSDNNLLDEGSQDNIKFINNSHGEELKSEGSMISKLLKLNIFIESNRTGRDSLIFALKKSKGVRSFIRHIP